MALAKTKNKKKHAMRELPPPVHVCRGSESFIIKMAPAYSRLLKCNRGDSPGLEFETGDTVRMLQWQLQWHPLPHSLSLLDPSAKTQTGVE